MLVRLEWTIATRCATHRSDFDQRHHQASERAAAQFFYFADCTLAQVPRAATHRQLPEFHPAETLLNVLTCTEFRALMRASRCWSTSQRASHIAPHQATARAVYFHRACRACHRALDILRGNMRSCRQSMQH